MRLTLASAALRRHRARTILAVAGVAVSAALLLDMVMLASGMRESFREFLLVRGFQLRITPKGTLPFDTEATIGNATAIVRTLEGDPRIEVVSPVLGNQLHVLRGGAAGEAVTAFGLGTRPAVQGDYERLAGRDPAGDEMVANRELLDAVGARIGDTLEVATGFDPQLRVATGRRRLVVTGTARFFYVSAGQRTIALPLATLQGMSGASGKDRVSLVMARVRDPAQVDSVRAWIERAAPQVAAISTDEALRQVDERLSYFRQLAFILGAISLVVGFLLVTTLVTVSVNERVGEIAVMRAIGVSRVHVVQQIVLEGVAISLGGAVLGLGLGLGTARYLNGILSDFPGLPVAFDFFLFQPRYAWGSLAMLTVAGILAGIYPAWRASSLPIAATLRQEAIA
jgi:putative ABC transport system permease protein